MVESWVDDRELKVSMVARQGMAGTTWNRLSFTDPSHALLFKLTWG
jgi:hypothetical protein